MLTNENSLAKAPFYHGVQCVSEGNIKGGNSVYPKTDQLTIMISLYDCTFMNLFL